MTPPVDPVEYVKSLSGENRELVLITLLNELRRIHGNSKIPIETADEFIGYFIPFELPDSTVIPELSELDISRKAEFDARSVRTHEAIPLAQMIEALRRQVDSTQIR